MKLFFNLFLILCSMFCISCKTEYAPPDPSKPISIPPKEDPYKPEINLPKEMQIVSEYTLTENNKSFYFESEDQDQYCYDFGDNKYFDEDLVPIRFRLYDKNNKLLREKLPILSNRSLIIEFKEIIKEYPPDTRSLDLAPEGIEKIKKGVSNTVWTYIPYHKEGVKIKAVLVDDTGKDVKVLAERGILSPEEFRKRPFYQGCYREAGFGYPKKQPPY